LAKYNSLKIHVEQYKLAYSKKNLSQLPYVLFL